MKIYSLVESAQLLGIDLATLRRWRAAASGAGARGSADGRRVWLSRAEVATLARAHGRVLVDAAPGGDVAELRRLVSDLSVRVAEMEALIVKKQPG